MGALVGVVLLLASAAEEGAGAEGRGERPAKVRRVFFGLSPAIFVGVGPFGTGFFLGGEVAVVVQVELGRVAVRFSLPAMLGVSGFIDDGRTTTTWGAGLGVEARIALVKGFALGAGAQLSLLSTTQRAGIYQLGILGLAPILTVAWRSGRHELAVGAQLVLPLFSFSAPPFLVGPRYTIFF